MDKSPEISKLTQALVLFQSQVSAVKKESANPFFKSKYADLSSIIEVIRKPLADNGLAFSQFPSGEFGLTTLLVHSSGEYISDTFTLRPMDAKPQSAGSALTYARRYALGAVLGIATEEDDDGNKASQKTGPAPEVKPSPDVVKQSLEMVAESSDPVQLEEWKTKMQTSKLLSPKDRKTLIDAIDKRQIEITKDDEAA